MITENMGKKFKGITTSSSFSAFTIGGFILLAICSLVSDYKMVLLSIEILIVVTLILYYLLGETLFFYFKRKKFIQIYEKLSEITETNHEHSTSEKIKEKFRKQLSLTQDDIKNFKKIKITKKVAHLSYF